MNTKELESLLVKKGACTKTEAQAFVACFLEKLSLEVKRDKRLLLKNFGQLEVVTRKARKGRLFSENTAITIPEKKQIRFTASTKFVKLLKRNTPKKIQRVNKK